MDEKQTLFERDLYDILTKFPNPKGRRLDFGLSKSTSLGVSDKAS